MMRAPLHNTLIVGAAVLLFVATAVVAMGTGAVQIPPSRVLTIVLGLHDPSITDAQRAVVMNVRVPRVLLALLAGAGLACAGVMMQALFRNPLADPALIGVSAGAALGAVCGVIGFVGLVAPHMARLLVGPDHRVVLPLASLIGATLLTAGDLVARTAVRSAELPIGILTAFMGAPFFLWLLRRRQAVGA